MGRWRRGRIEARLAYTALGDANPVARAVFLEPVVRRDDTALSLEDTLEWRAYEQAREGGAAPTWFMTRDTDFPEGVHPIHLAREVGWC